MTDFLEAGDFDDEVQQRLRDVAALILSGLDQSREALGYKMGTVPWKRMGQLADRIAIETADWTAAEGQLIGHWLYASSRAQLAERE